MQVHTIIKQKEYKMQFIDKAKIKISSGKGGNGVVAWRREKFVDKGGPAGGPGITLQLPVKAVIPEGLLPSFTEWKTRFLI